jgi:thiamine-monophosphate kinase
MPGEFDLIRRYFRDATRSRPDVLLGIDDDCALVQVPQDRVLAISSDTLVSGHHFTPDVDPEALGHKALAVNLSDLAAMGAEPAWASLCLTLPQADEAWLQAFMRGFARLADEYGVQLIGGDTTRGPLGIGVTVQGFVDPARALRRDGAREGDLIYVSGTLGDAGLALRVRQGEIPPGGDMRPLDERLDRPQPRVGLGRRLGTYSRCAIDISDGLAGDLGHICRQSRLGALLELERLPLSAAVRDRVRTSGDWSLPLSAGDDYELLFTVPAARQAEFEREAATWELPVTRIGLMQRGEGVRLHGAQGAQSDRWMRAYDHFRE